MKKSLLSPALLLALGFLSQGTYAQKNQKSPLIKPTLNIQKEFKGKIGRTLAESQEYWAPEVKAPKGAPNVVWVLLDDVGYGAASVFGGLIKTPTFEALANSGLRYTNFHTCAISAPTRAALLTGRNSSAVHMAGFAHTYMSAGFPGWDGRIPSSAGTVAEILRENGYNTFAVGKYGLTPDEEASDAGPFDRWPTGKGFDHFFGFLGSQTDQYKPNLVEDQAHVKPDGRHLTTQITDKAIEYIDRQKKAAPNKPFFLYYAPGATHAPHQVDTSWSNKYIGQFDEGWDVYREKVIAHQKKLGVIPANAQLPPRDSTLKAWSSLPDQEKKLYARFMEVYAGFLEYTDSEVGRVLQHLKDIGQYDNTLVYVVIGDNGASKEGTFNGNVDRSIYAGVANEKENIEHNLAKIGEIGTPTSSEGNYPLGWAQAANTPFRLWKSDAQAEGGTHNPLIISYPNGNLEKGGLRNQYGHVNDLLPTTLEYIGIKAPSKIRGIEQDPIQGTSLAYSFNNAKAPTKKHQQIYYIFGNRAIYKDGWKAGTQHYSRFKVAQDPSAKVDYNNDVWELYNLNEDFNELHNLASQHPEKLKELQADFEQEAKVNNLYPFIDFYDVFNRRIHKNVGGTIQEQSQKALK